MTVAEQGIAVMGDMSAEPSMEEILSSIKRIIAEEESGPTRGRRMGRVVQAPVEEEEDEDEVLELSEPVEAVAPQPEPQPEPPAAVQPERRPEPVAVAPEPVRAESKPVSQPVTPPPAPAAVPEAIVSSQTVAASRGALDQLARLMVKPEPGSDGTLEGLVREMLRPVLREWLDANLPGMVEAMVQSEIKRITGGLR
jgi:cell pole-organizing protein PopZ